MTPNKKANEEGVKPKIEKSGVRDYDEIIKIIESVQKKYEKITEEENSSKFL